MCTVHTDREDVAQPEAASGVEILDVGVLRMDGRKKGAMGMSGCVCVCGGGGW